MRKPMFNGAIITNTKPRRDVTSGKHGGTSEYKPSCAHRHFCRKILLCVVAVTLAAMLCGCSLDLLDNTADLRPPKATGSEAEIQDCIDELSGGSYTLKYPNTGDYRTAIIMYDIDGDNTEESIAFYMTDDKTAGINIAVLDKGADGTWYASMFSSSYSEIDRVFFCDLDGDGTHEPVIGWNNYGAQPSYITAYVKSGSAYKELGIEQTYTDAVAGNFTDNNFDSIMLFSLESTAQSACAALITMNDQKDNLKLASTADMDSNVVEYESITKGYVDKSTIGVVVDGRDASSHSITQVLYCDYSSNLVNPFLEDTALRRDTGLVSTDINLDGIIEIPTYSKMSSGEDEDDSEVSSCVIWNTCDTDNQSLEDVMYTIYNESGGYLIEISYEEYLNYTARQSGSALSVYEWDGDTGELGSLMFTVTAFAQEEYTSQVSAEYTQLAEDDGTVYAVRTESGSAFSAQDVAQRFSLSGG